jgi:hypothetical protein
MKLRSIIAALTVAGLSASGAYRFFALTREK